MGHPMKCLVGRLVYSISSHGSLIGRPIGRRPMGYPTICVTYCGMTHRVPHGMRCFRRADPWDEL